MENKTILRNDNILKLSDGRRLAYVEYGDPDGPPVFLVHGPPAAGFTGNLFLVSLSGLIYTSLPRIDPDTVSRTGGLAEQ